MRLQLGKSGSNPRQERTLESPPMNAVCKGLKCRHCFLFQAQFDASELITQREMVSQAISQQLVKRAASFGVILDDIAIVRVGYQRNGASQLCASY